LGEPLEGLRRHREQCFQQILAPVVVRTTFPVFAGLLLLVGEAIAVSFNNGSISGSRATAAVVLQLGARLLAPPPS
jgi:hypothetical protein